MESKENVIICSKWKALHTIEEDGYHSIQYLGTGGVFVNAETFEEAEKQFIDGMMSTMQHRIDEANTRK